MSVSFYRRWDKQPSVLERFWEINLPLTRSPGVMPEIMCSMCCCLNVQFLEYLKSCLLVETVVIAQHFLLRSRAYRVLELGSSDAISCFLYKNLFEMVQVLFFASSSRLRAVSILRISLFLWKRHFFVITFTSSCIKIGYNCWRWVFSANIFSLEAVQRRGTAAFDCRIT